MCLTLAVLYEMCWVLQNYSNFGGKQGEKGSLIFRREGSNLPKVDWVTPTVSSPNMVRLQTAPDELRARVLESLGQLMNKKKSRHGYIEKRPDVYEFVLDGKLWMPRNGKSRLMGRR
jgi:hypothetical protein